MTLTKKIIILSIFLLALILRLYRTSEVPISLNRDEVGLGYDAYSLLKTGRDQFGKFLPLTLRSSDDYKPALYAYLVAPSIAVFGVSSLAVRLPSALLGVSTVLATFFLVEVIFETHKSVLMIALVSSLLLAISPWHIQFSRGAFEANVSLFFIVAGVLFFFQGLVSAKKAFTSGTLFGLSLLTYHAARFVGPVLLFSLLIIHHREWQRCKKQIVVLLATFSFFFALSLPALLSPEAQVRLRILSIFADSKDAQQSAENILLDQKLGLPISGKIVHNRRLIPFSYYSLSKLFDNYKKHFDPSIAIFGIDKPRLQSHHVPDFGVIYFWEALFAVFGFLTLLKSYLNKRTLLILLWFIFGLLPAAITWDIPSYLRAILVLPTIQILAALGIVAVGGLLLRESKHFRFLGSLLFSAWLMFSLVAFLHQYFVHLNYETAENWRYGRKEAALAAEKIKSQFRRIIVSTKLDDPHIFFLFHLKYDPQRYLADGGTVRGGWTATENRFDKYEFHPLPDKDKFEKEAEVGVLYIGFPEEVSSNARVIKTIYYPNDEEAIRLVEK